MKIYFAPLEGITTYIFRNAYERYYGHIEKYFAPFISPADNCAMNPKERRDVLPENNICKKLVPQIMTCKSHHFIDAAELLIEMGYKEINLNLGCPSGTVCSKGKGAGFLFDTDKLDDFLYDIYEYADKKGIEISLKTRLGKYEAREWFELLEIYNKYDVSELIVHPRIQSDFYKGEPRIEFFEYAIDNSDLNLVYNGNIFNETDIDRFIPDEKKDVLKNGIMLGRGILKNPELPINILEGKNKFDVMKFKEFHNEVYNGYKEIMSPDINVVYRMKELWTYFIDLFPDDERLIRNMYKCKRFSEYEPLFTQLINRNMCQDK